MKTHALIITGYGINAQDELREAFEIAGAHAEIQHIQNVIEKPELLLKADYLGFPGGFSFGDHLGSGRVLANLLLLKLRPAIENFIQQGGLVIGICNGFQTLVKSGLLPGFVNIAGSAGNHTGENFAFTKEKPESAIAMTPLVSLIHNMQGTFIDTWVSVEFPENSHCVWTKSLAPRLLPIRHGEGRFVAADMVLDTLERDGLVAVRYRDNPNGSMRNIAGICDRTGRVFGLMPHPEASIHTEVHPERRRSMENLLGIDMFINAVAYRESVGKSGGIKQ